VQHRPQGRLDSPLTELGVQQARAHAQTLHHVPFARAYTSPMQRAQRTAALILAGRSISLTVLDDLAEVDAGILAGTLPAERLARFPELAAARQRDKYRTVLPEGESYETAGPRAARAIAQIQAEGPGNVLIVSHEMIGRLLRMHLLSLTPEQAMQTNHPQDVIYRVAHGELSVFAPLSAT
jgi:broad specificity phosphatase PhoE